MTGITRFEDLLAWQRMHELNSEILRCTSQVSICIFLDYSRASALEAKRLLKTALEAGYLSGDEYLKLDRLATRGLQAVAKFQRYLRSPRAKRNASKNRHRRKRGGSLKRPDRE